MSDSSNEKRLGNKKAKDEGAWSDPDALVEHNQSGTRPTEVKRNTGVSDSADICGAVRDWLTQRSSLRCSILAQHFNIMVHSIGPAIKDAGFRPDRVSQLCRTGAVS
jgi:hypothetical protein